VSADQVPERRAYRSQRRRQQAAETRVLILAAASRLFGERGWVGTGVRDVAGEAGVSVETVYANFKTKGDMLIAALDVAVVGDDEPVPLDRRAEFEALGSGPRNQRLAAAARLVTDVHRRTAGVVFALREAAASDPALDLLMREREQARRHNVEEGMALVVGHPITPEQADAMWAVLDIGLYRMLTDLRGWTSKHYETWVADAIDRLLDDGRKVESTGRELA